ncbi:MAG: acetate kinase [Eubacteriales bacterium]
MNVLVINCGSSSLKFQLIDGVSEKELAKGICDRIGIDGFLSYQAAGQDKIKKELEMPNHTVAIHHVLESLTNKEYGVVKSLNEIAAVGHRIVHGGEAVSDSVLLTEDVMGKIEVCSELAPLHNPANMIGIRACMEELPNVKMVGVFDTAFHQTIPEKAFLYGIPYSYYKEHKIRRYGFHGTSHDYVSKRAVEFAGMKREDSKVIVCHLGNGASISAVLNGKSVDTSMGFTPLEGLLMGTRSGDLDPAIVEFIANKEGKSVAEIINVFNKESGVLGVSELSSDFRDLEDASKAGDERAIRALEVYAYRIAKYIGSYMMAMGGVDIIAFTAGIGENDGGVRAMVGKYLEPFGTNVNTTKNQVRGEEVILSDDGSKILTMIIPTNEELAIARATMEVISK